jgi:hypothetical protein
MTGQKYPFSFPEVSVYCPDLLVHHIFHGA